jgi:hypothetical protein
MALARLYIIHCALKRRQPDCVALNEIQPLVGAYRIRPITKTGSIIRAYAIRPYRSHTANCGFPTQRQ